MNVTVRVVRCGRIRGGKCEIVPGLMVLRGSSAPRVFASWAPILRRLGPDDRLMVCYRFDGRREELGLIEERALYRAAGGSGRL